VFVEEAVGGGGSDVEAGAIGVRGVEE